MKVILQVYRPKDGDGVRSEDHRRDQGGRLPRGTQLGPAGPEGGGDTQEAPGTPLHHSTPPILPNARFHIPSLRALQV